MAAAVSGRVPRAAPAKLLSRDRSRLAAGSSFGGLRPSLGTRVANGLDLGQALLLQVNAHSDELDYRLGDAQAALQFVDGLAAGINGEQDVEPFPEVANHVGEAALAHALRILHAATGGGDLRLEGGNELVHVLIGHIGTNNKHNFVTTLHCVLQSKLAAGIYSPRINAGSRG